MSEEIVEENLFPAIIAAFPEAVGKSIRAVAFKIDAMAVANAPHKTGFLRSSIYVRTQDSSTYGQTVEGDGSGTLLPPVAAPNTPLTAIVAVGASYGVYIEMGTRFKPARPFLIPAAEKAAPMLDAAFAALEERLRELL